MTKAAPTTPSTTAAATPPEKDALGPNEVREVIIVGSGPSGYTAAVYAARANLRPVVFEGAVTAGGALMNTTEVENFPGFPAGIMGPDLMEAMRSHAERFGAQMVRDDVTAMSLTGPVKTVTDGEGTIWSARSVILAMGSAYRQMGIPDEQRLSGHGPGRPDGALAVGDRLDRAVQGHLGHVVADHLGAEAFGLGAHGIHQVGAHDGLRESGEVLDLGGVHQGPARSDRTLEKDRAEVGAGGIDRGGVASRAGADDDDVTEPVGVEDVVYL